MRILVTGAAGFIGSNLGDDLLRKGHIVLGLDNFDPFYHRTIKENNIKSALASPSYSFREGDIRDGVFINDCLSEFKPDLIVHLAARAGVRPSIINPREYYEVNVLGTLNILEKMRDNNVKKMIFASSSSVYGNNREVPFSEKDNVDNPISPYAASKKAGELICHTFHHLYGFDIFCLRFFTVYGPRQRPDLAISKFTRAIIRNQPLTIYGDGSSRRDYTYIDDILQGISGAIENISGFELYNLGESNTVSLTDLVLLIERHTRRKAVLNYLPVQEGDVFQTYADISKARAEIKYSPTVDIEAGIVKYIEWLARSVQPQAQAGAVN